MNPQDEIRASIARIRIDIVGLQEDITRLLTWTTIDKHQRDMLTIAHNDLDLALTRLRGDTRPVEGAPLI